MSFLIILGIALASPARAQYTVTDPNDDGGAGSLRTQIGDSNTAANPIVSWSSVIGGTTSLNGTLTIDNTNANTTQTTLDVSNADSPVTISGSTISLTTSVTFENNSTTQTFTINSVVSGGGMLTKQGNGTLALTGLNGFTGNTVIDLGTLNVNGDGALGNPGSEIVFNGGTLQTGSSFTSARSIYLSGNGTFDPDGNSPTFSGVISGPGALVLNGNGTMYLTGANTYTGGTQLIQGTLNINSDAALGTGGLTFGGGTLQLNASSLVDYRTILLSGNGTIDDGGNDATFAGLITGPGELIKVGTGTLVLSGTNVYGGGTSINAGVLSITSESNLGDPVVSLTLNGGTLLTQSAVYDEHPITIGASSGTIENGDNYDVFAGSITGPGSLTLTGSGGVTLSNPNNTYAGGTNVTAGTLYYGANNAISNGPLSVSAGAVVDLNGFSQSTGMALGTVSNDGLINVRSGTLSLGSGYLGTGTLAVTVAPGVTNVTANNMNVTGTTLNVSLANPLTPVGTVFTPVQAGLLGGPFASIVSPALLDFVPTYSSTTLSLTLQLVPFSSISATPNEKTVGSGLEAFRTAPSGDMGTVLSNLYSLTLPGVQAALDQIGPVALTSMGSMGLASSAVQSSALDKRMASLANGEGGGFDVFSMNNPSASPGTLLADAGADDMQPIIPLGPPSEGPVGFFASAVGTEGKLNNITGSAGVQPGYTFESGGLLLGIDRRLGESFAIGLSGGYLYDNASMESPAEGSVVNNSARYGAYMTDFTDTARANVYVGGAQDFFSTSRGIDFAGISRTATASPRGDEFNWKFSFDFDARHDGWATLSPFAGIQGDHLTIHSFTETGADALDLAVGQQTADSLRSDIGMRESIKIQDQGMTCLGYLSAAWDHEFDNQSRPIDAQLASGAGSVFSITTADYPRDGALLGAGLSFKTGEQSTFNLDYVYDVRSGFSENQLSANLRLRF